MKSRAKKDKKESELCFPKLMISTFDGTVVFFIKEGAGTVILSCNDVEPLGYYLDSWNILKFTDYTGEITLSND